MKPFFIVGLAEDSIKFAESFPAIFINSENLNIKQKNKITESEKYFNFNKFYSTGAAKNYITNRNIQNKLDLFIIDVDFSDLTNQIIDDENTKYNILLRLDTEKKDTIGVDFWKYLRESEPQMISMLLTGKYVDSGKPQIGKKIDNEMQLIKGVDFELKEGNAISFTRNIYRILQQLTQNIIRKEFTHNTPLIVDFWKEFIKTTDVNGFLNAEITFKQRTAPFNKTTIKQLLIGWGKWEIKDKKLDLTFDDSIKDTFLNMIKKAGVTGETVTFKGIWKDDFMQSALSKFKSSISYQDDLDNINTKSKELFDDFLKEFDGKRGKAATMFQKTPECSKYLSDSIDNNQSFKSEFRMALIHRRFLIALSYYGKEKGIEYILSAIQYLNITATPENLTNYITTDLGLCSSGIKSKSNNPIKIIYEETRKGATIMREESDFLENFIRPNL